MGKDLLKPTKYTEVEATVAFVSQFMHVMFQAVQLCSVSLDRLSR
jgi:hypothetical protein